MAAAQQTEEQAHQLPPKIANNGRIPSVDRLQVQLNAFQLDIRQAVSEIFVFELRFMAERTPREGQQPKPPSDLSRGPKNDESKETRRRLLWQLFRQLLERNPADFGTDNKKHIFDCALLLFSVNSLGTQIDQKREYQLEVDRNALEDRCRAYIRNFATFRVSLLRTRTINVREAHAAYARGDRSLVQFLEVLSSQRIYEQGHHYCFGNKFYEAESTLMLQGDPRILKVGQQKNVRFVGDKDNAVPIVQVDPKKSAFFPGQNLLQFVCAFINMQPNQLQHNWRDQFERINKQVRGLVLATTHLDNPITFSTVGLARATADEQTFEREGRQVTVAAHYQTAYHQNLQFPGLPCVIQRIPQKESYYPMELLAIVQGQRVPIEKQTPKLVEQMIRQCQVLPADLPQQIQDQRDTAFIQNANPFFKATNVRVNPDLMRTEATLLFPPAIQYAANDRVEPDNRGVLNWRMVGRDVNPRRTFAVPADYPKLWAVVIVQQCVSMDACRRFCESFRDTAVRRGLTACQMPPRVDQFEQTNLEYVRDKFQFYQHHKCLFLLVFAPGKRAAHPGDIHHVLKLMEQQYDVLTQHISPEIMDKGAGGGGGAAMVVENILMKTNLKLGGANYLLSTSNAFRQASRNQQDILQDIWLGSKRQFIGIDFSHAPPQNLYDRQAGKAPAIPTVVGMAWTINKVPTTNRGTYWMQQPRQTTMREEHVRPFIEAIKGALIAYETETDAVPEHVIVFRAGASEGEFKQISYWEGNAFVQAFHELAKLRRGQFQAPAVTLIVCQRQSNYRIFPPQVNRQAKAPEQNVQPGTAVDKNVMNAALTEFLLVAHRALQGTAQPVRCTVVFEWRPSSGPAARFQPQMPVEEIENITNALCYSHGIFTGSTAVPGVLYSAGELSKRGRNNWKMHTADGAEVRQFDVPPPLGQQGEEAQQQLDNERAEYFRQVSETLNPSIPTKFWA